jgi:transcriptional regulator with XRE-family HTH domain
MPTNDRGLYNLGLRLRAERLKRNESQSTFAARIGVSVPTLRKMEGGDPTVTIGKWAAVLDVLDRTKDLEAVLAEPEDLFAKYDNLNASPRQRASKRLP